MSEETIYLEITELERQAVVKAIEFCLDMPDSEALSEEMGEAGKHVVAMIERPDVYEGMYSKDEILEHLVQSNEPVPISFEDKFEWFRKQLLELPTDGFITMVKKLSKFFDDEKKRRITELETSLKKLKLK